MVRADASVDERFFLGEGEEGGGRGEEETGREDRDAGSDDGVCVVEVNIATGANDTERDVGRASVVRESDGDGEAGGDGGSDAMPL